MEQITGYNYYYPSSFYESDSEDDSFEEELFEQDTDYQIYEENIGLTITDESSGPDSSEDEEALGEGLVVDAPVVENPNGEIQIEQQIGAPPLRPANHFFSSLRVGRKIVKPRCNSTVNS